MGRVILACKSDEERKMATCPVFAPYPIHTDRQAESVRHCVDFRSGITDSTGNRKDLGSIPSGVEAFLFSQKISSIIIFEKSHLVLRVVTLILNHRWWLKWSSLICSLIQERVSFISFIYFMIFTMTIVIFNNVLVYKNLKK